MEEPPEVLPKDWKVIRMQLLQNVKKEDAPPESSYYGIVTGMLIDWFKHKSSNQKDGYDDARYNLLDNWGCVYCDRHYWVKTESVVKHLKIQGQSIDVRKVAHLFRTEFNAEPTKTTLQKKEIRCWKIPKDNVDGSSTNNVGSSEQYIEAYKEFKKNKEKRLGRGLFDKNNY